MDVRMEFTSLHALTDDEIESCGGGPEGNLGERTEQRGPTASRSRTPAGSCGAKFLLRR